jgi:trans-2,3-dihydro-3-hydroxyanthranilate isomerase
MPTYSFIQVDAFTNQPFSGNPCAVFFEADDLDDQTKLAIAREMNLSESAFVRRSEVADFGARYFTPAEEIPMAGHPTIATTFALIDSGRLQLTNDLTEITLELQVGPIPVEIYAQDGIIQRIVMTQKKPQFLSTYPPEEVLPIFGLSPDDALPYPIQTVSTGTPQLMVPLRTLAALQKIEMNVAAYRELRTGADFFSPHLFCLQGITDAGQTFARLPVRRPAGWPLICGTMACLRNPPSSPNKAIG